MKVRIPIGAFKEFRGKILEKARLPKKRMQVGKANLHPFFLGIILALLLPFPRA